MISRSRKGDVFAEKNATYGCRSHKSDCKLMRHPSEGMVTARLKADMQPATQHSNLDAFLEPHHPAHTGGRSFHGKNELTNDIKGFLRSR
ncbi:hypothetical protein [Mesorhizobium kowhaii]|uniref:hypothetical protein n=1 Tax=Mesorhizobium kowhaii TaxID=1300272 RepID=UPI0011B67805|nr:hypothetical protein [Mesorhizobium kowhaii]